MKYFCSVILFACCLSVFFFSCSDDYIEKGIEGQWQMRKVVKSDGSEQKVDSLFYLFKKGVFKYIIMETDLDSYIVFGTYSKDGDKLLIKVEPLTIPNGCEDCLQWEGELDREFTIKKESSSALELQYNEDLYIFRKH